MSWDLHGIGVGVLGAGKVGEAEEDLANGLQVGRAAIGVQRPFVGGGVALELSGPGVIVGDNPFRWEESGGAGAVWIKTLPDRAGRIRVTAAHPVLGKQSVETTVHRISGKEP